MVDEEQTFEEMRDRARAAAWENATDSVDASKDKLVEAAALLALVCEEGARDLIRASIAVESLRIRLQRRRTEMGQ